MHGRPVVQHRAPRLFKERLSSSPEPAAAKTTTPTAAESSSPLRRRKSEFAVSSIRETLLLPEFGLGTDVELRCDGELLTGLDSRKGFPGPMVDTA